MAHSLTDGPHAKKSLGQHWLEDAESLQAMCDAAKIQICDDVLEIGPGYGTLTAQLLASGANVTALEFDASLVPHLTKQFKNFTGGELHIELGDIRTYDYGNMPPDFKIVANIPYYLTSNLIQLISEALNSPSIAVLLMQKEVAERIVTKPGAMSLLSVTAQYFWEVSLGRVVEAELFVPPPKVDSQILILKRRPQPLFPDADPKQFFRLVKAGYSQKRKTLANSLSGGLAIERPQALAMLEKAGIDAGRRAQMLSLDEWHQLYEVL